ncbi:DUF3159 domain-containing protein [Cryobacterium psychrophilum]|uniref:DUF3159 domain-containing protein n=1 Tax=Cryobacterium psychrophilum TaxID=41988 RepID=A0A4Y8KS16_9MICO|nr:DUF3159 domain-containing protein [Cryobacterium psychrophilum]TDW31389.1 uncharacterized protein DUF3159 [Cryobacterium psychrophilum]TFD78834.1 DUF3159 domain-containing protein [Cryobacterium psychrophilum]
MTDRPDSADRPDSEPHQAVPDETDAAQPTASGVVADGMAAAARRAGFGSAVDGEPINGKALMVAMGGVRGLFEAVLPGLVFLVTYTLTIDPGQEPASDTIRTLIPALVAPLLLGLLFVALRAITRQTTTPAVGGLVGTGLSVALALFSGKASDFFLVGLYTNAGYGAALLISVLVGWPLVGLAVGFLMGDGVNWRSDPSKRRVLTILTLAWTGLFLARLAVQLPLYLADNVELLATTKLLMGLPLYAPLLVVSWLMVRSVYRKPAPAA